MGYSPGADSFFISAGDEYGYPRYDSSTMVFDSDEEGFASAEIEGLSKQNIAKSHHVNPGMALAFFL